MITTTWNDFAICKDLPTEIFFPPVTAGAGSLKKAREICNQCPVQEACLEYALVTFTSKEDESGMYGGTTFRERREIRKARRELARL